MEIFELRYFLGVAEHENIHRASEKQGVSPASLSKAIQRLEDELGVPLFTKQGRNIFLTDHGRLLQKKASEIIQLEEATKLQLSGHKGTIKCVMVGPEILLTDFGLQLAEELRKKFKGIDFEFQSTDEKTALAKVDQGEAHLALTTGDVPSGMTSKRLGSSTFQTCVGRGHSLYENARSKKSVAVEKVLEHPFASPSYAFLGQVGNKQSVDGWRDDQFPRKIQYVTSCLKMLEKLVLDGKALAYLPDFYAQRLDVKVIKVTGCPYSCTQELKLVARNPGRLGWLNQVF